MGPLLPGLFVSRLAVDWDKPWTLLVKYRYILIDEGQKYMLSDKLSKIPILLSFKNLICFKRKQRLQNRLQVQRRLFLPNLFNKAPHVAWKKMWERKQQKCIAQCRDAFWIVAIHNSSRYTLWALANWVCQGGQFDHAIIFGNSSSHSFHLFYNLFIR